MAIVATDAIRHHRVAFTTSEILQWPLLTDLKGRFPKPAPILSKGVELSLAVAASSCFPPVFPRLHLTHRELGIIYSEFKEDLQLNDGGVLTNLGIEVLVALRERGWTDKTFILIGDAERPQAAKPGSFPLTDINASTTALSMGARELAATHFSKRCALIQFSDRAETPEGLSHRAETVLFGYRTDLDAPAWQEIHALMLHGAMLARKSTDGVLTPTSPALLRAAIAAIITAAGGPTLSAVPTEGLISKCSRLPLSKVLANGIVVVLIVVAALYVLYSLVL